jgi:HTH-type transcriptional regulator/antitoxin HipB
MDYPARTTQQLAPILVSYRKLRGVNQSELAGRLGISQQALSELEREPQTASMTRVMQYCAALGVEIVFRDTKTVDINTTKPKW